MLNFKSLHPPQEKTLIQQMAKNQCFANTPLSATLISQLRSSTARLNAGSLELESRSRKVDIILTQRINFNQVIKYSLRKRRYNIKIKVIFLNLRYGYRR